MGCAEIIVLRRRNIYCGLRYDANPKVLMKRRHKGRTQASCLTDATNDTASKTFCSTDNDRIKKVFFPFLFHQTIPANTIIKMLCLLPYIATQHLH